MDIISRLFDPSGFVPRRLCGEWSGELICLHTISDALIWLAYLAISTVLVFFVRRRDDVPFPGMFCLFGAFIVSCGFTHLLEVVIFYHPLYRLAGALKAATALVSWATVIALGRVIPRALTFRGPDELEREVTARTAELARANDDLRREVAERLGAEQSLRDERERFRVTLASIGDGVLATDRHGAVTFLNPVACLLTGWREDEALGRPADEVFRVAREGSRAPVESPAAVALRSGKPAALSNDAVLMARDGSERCIDNCAAPIGGAGGVTGTVLVFRDVTERRWAEGERRRAGELLRAVADETTDAVFVKDRRGRYLLFNPAAARFVGKPAEEVLGKDDTKLFDPECARQVMERDRRVMDTGRAGTEEECLTAAGVTRTFLTTKAPYRDHLGNVLGVIGISRDITERKRTEEELRLRDRAIRAVSQGVLITDPGQPDNPIIYASPGFERLTGYTAEEAVGRNCRFLRGKDTDPDAAARVRDAVRAGRECSVELLNYRKDGTTFWNALDIAPVRDGGRVTHFVGILADVTRQRRLEEQLRQSQKMEAVGQLAGGVAHDFNNLLTIISGYSEVLMSALPPGDPSRSSLDAICDAGVRAASLTRQLLAFSRKAVLDPKVLDLNDEVRETEKMLRRLIGEDVRLTTALAPDARRVKVDPGQLVQVLMNLAVNARDAMPRGGQLTLATRNVNLGEDFTRDRADVRPGPHVLLTVGDTGHGMTPEVKAHIFEPFFTTKGVGKGTGLGLAVVHGIVKQSGGCVEVESEPGRGTTFAIYLPAAGGAPGVEREPEAGAEPGGTETVLVVEDEDAVRRLATVVLQSHGYRVLAARDGEEALRVAEMHGGAIDLLVTDVVMPNLDGRGLAEALRPLRPRMKVLYVSGYTDDAVVRYGVLHEDAAFLPKPYRPLALARKARQVLDQRRGD